MGGIGLRWCLLAVPFATLYLTEFSALCVKRVFYSANSVVPLSDLIESQLERLNIHSASWRGYVVTRRFRINCIPVTATSPIHERLSFWRVKHARHLSCFDHTAAQHKQSAGIKI